MRSTSFTMRSVSSQMSRVSARSSSDASVSRSCAAPRMPDSGFLISCASIEAIAETDRAAPRCACWRSSFSAMVRSRSITTIVLLCGISGVTKMSTSRSTPSRGRPRSTRYSLIAPPSSRICSISAMSEDPIGSRPSRFCLRCGARLVPKNDSAAGFALSITPSSSIVRIGFGRASRTCSAPSAPTTPTTAGSGSDFNLVSPRRRKGRRALMRPSPCVCR